MEAGTGPSPPADATQESLAGSRPPVSSVEGKLPSVPPQDTLVSFTQDGPQPEPVGAAPQIEGYELRQRLGEGGMGVVWRATQNSTRRDVALKVMSPAMLGSARAAARFDREVELAASLEHECIARVYEGGRHQGLPFYAMELVRGQPLDAFVRTHAAARAEVVRLVWRVCQGMQYAHQRGVIHRDLKPSNIMVTETGLPKILDFGLAKSVQSGSGVLVSMAGDVAGTPAYMSPEQARGEVDRLDTRSDVYALGVILYRLLTGLYPHDVSGPYMDVLRRVSEDEPVRPRRVDPTIDPDLEAILLKALAQLPDERYSSAGDLGDDLRRYLAHEVVLARPQTFIYVVRKQVRRHRVRFLAAALALTLAAAGLTAYVVSVRAERERALAAQRRADQARQLADQRLQHAHEQRAAALQTLNDLVFGAQRAMEAEGASVRLRQAMLGITQRALERVAQLAEDGPRGGEAARAAAMLVVLGDLSRQAGDAEGALDHYERAEAAWRQVAADEPDHPVLRRNHAVALIRQGQAALELGRWEVAAGAFDEADTILQAPAGSAVEATTADRFALLLGRGDASAARSDPESARAQFGQAVQLASNELAVPGADEATWRRLRATALRRQARAIDPNAAPPFDLVRGAIEDLRSVHRLTQPPTPRSRTELAEARGQYAHLLAGQGHREQAQAELADALRELEAQPAAAPAPEVLRVQVHLTLQLADLRAPDQPDSAAADYRRCLDLLDRYDKLGGSPLPDLAAARAHTQHRLDASPRQ